MLGPLAVVVDVTLTRALFTRAWRDALPEIIMGLAMAWPPPGIPAAKNLPSPRLLDGQAVVGASSRAT